MTVKRELVPTTVEHADELANYLRAEDRAELEAIGADAFAVVMAGCKQYAYTLLVNGRVACIFGLETASPFAIAACPWMLSTNSMEGSTMYFARASKKVIAHWSEHYPLLYNYVDSRYTKSIRWLRWCGFTIIENALITADGTPFHRFEMRKP